MFCKGFERIPVHGCASSLHRTPAYDSYCMHEEKIATVPEPVTGEPRRVAVGGGLRHTFRALAHRNYRLYFTGQVVSLTGTWMQQTALSWLIYEITGSK